MTTVLFFIAGWGLLILLLMLLPSIFERRMTLLLAGISGVIAMVAIASEQTLSWPVALASGLLLTGAVSFIAAKRLTAMDDTLTLQEDETVKHEQDQIEDGVDAEPPATAAPVPDTVTEDTEEETAGEPVYNNDETEDPVDEQEMIELHDDPHDDTDTEDEIVEDVEELEEEPASTEDEEFANDEEQPAKQFVITSNEDGEEEEDEDEGDLSSARLTQEDEEESVMERRPLNEDDGEPLMRRSSAIDADEFALEDTKNSNVDQFDEDQPERQTDEPELKESKEEEHNDAAIQDRRKRLFESLDDDEA